MRSTRNPAGFTTTELAGVLLAGVILLAVTLPGIGGIHRTSGVQRSVTNLSTLGAAHFLYAADWSGRQVTFIRDDMGAYGSVGEYNYIHGCSGPSTINPECQPPIIAGYGPSESGHYVRWGYWGNNNVELFAVPILFPPRDDGPAWGGWGGFRIPNMEPFHDYVNGRCHEPTFFAPHDPTVMELVGPCLGSPDEFDPDCNPGWSSYCFSSAAMFHPDVMRSNALGGWQDAWDLDHGFESPGLFQALYPDLKTHMCEHNWLQNAPADCNPIFPGYCVPFLFNHGIESSPVTLFYDSSVRLLPNAEVYAADQQVLQATGGVDGLWHRGTPFGENGFFIDTGYDGAPLSHHILTTDGILGRDTLGTTPPTPLSAPDRRQWRRTRNLALPMALRDAPADPMPMTPEENEP